MYNQFSVGTYSESGCNIKICVIYNKIWKNCHRIYDFINWNIKLLNSHFITFNLEKKLHPA